jgi:hypothetical protein
MSKAKKVSVKKKVSGKAKRAVKSRATPLAVVEPRLRAPRTSRTAKPRAQAPQPVAHAADTEVSGNNAGQMVHLMLTWSPWNLMLRQQGILISMLSAMTRPDKSTAFEVLEAGPIKRRPARKS